MHRQPIRQIAYAAPDPVEAARRHHHLFGSGPFFIAEHVPVRDYVHRGTSRIFDHSTVFGQWGALMVEFFVQHNDAPSHNHDLYRFGTQAVVLHHCALIVGDLDREIDGFADKGAQLAARFRLDAGFEVAMIDARESCGHMIELYEGEGPVNALYAMVEEAARDFGEETPLFTRLDL